MNIGRSCLGFTVSFWHAVSVVCSAYTRPLQLVGAGSYNSEIRLLLVSHGAFDDGFYTIQCMYNADNADSTHGEVIMSQLADSLAQ